MSKIPVVSTPRWGIKQVLLALLPLLFLGGLIGVLIVSGDMGLGTRTAPPIEELTIDRITLPERDRILVDVTNGGADEVTIAQVQVDDAYWAFSISPDATIPRLGQATISLPYPWSQDETHIIKLVSSNGVTFEGEIPVATLTPGPDLDTFWRYALLGIYVGFVPVSLGLLWYPSLRHLGRRGMQAILSLTIGLLAFLLVDTFTEALDIINTVPVVFGGGLLVFFVALLAFLSLLLIGSRKQGQTPSRLKISYFIALGIGLHNLGEGLAIGAAFALGNAALGLFLIIGFTLHNVTEGVGIAAPIAREQPALRHFLFLAALAGLPAVAGVWVGGFIYHALAVAVFLALGAGAIAQVIFEVGRLIVQQSAQDQTPVLSPATFGGLAVGILLMYGTSLLVVA